MSRYALHVASEPTLLPRGDTVDLRLRVSQGYEGIDINFDTMFWGGLEYNGLHSLLDGSVSHGGWYYAVGSSNAFAVPGTRGIPGPGTVEQAVELYVQAAPVCG